jgi:hypothetical protein
MAVSVEYALTASDSMLQAQVLRNLNATTQDEIDAVYQSGEYVNELNQVRLVERLLRAFWLAIAYLAFPILWSFAFTLLHPQRRLVPPLFIHAIAFAWMIPYGVYRFVFSGQGETFGLLTAGGVVMVIASILIDEMMLKIFGYSTDKKHLLTRVLKVEGITLEQLEDRLLKQGLRNTLYLKKQSKKDGERVILQTRSDAEYSSYIELTQNPDDKKIIMSLVFFETGRYFTIVSDELEEYANRQVGHLLESLNTDDCMVLKLTNYPPSVVEKLVKDATNDLSGKIGQAKITKRHLAMSAIFSTAFALPLVNLAFNWDKGVTTELLTLIGVAAGIFATGLTVNVYNIRKQQKE